MKNKWLIITGIVIVVLVGLIIVFDEDNEKYLSEITYSEFNSLVKNDKDFILYVKQTGCQHCQAFTPKLVSVLNKYQIKAYYINLSNLTKDENVSFGNIYNVEGTPMVLFFEKGEPISTTIDGDKTKNVIVNKFKLVGYIKED